MSTIARAWLIDLGNSRLKCAALDGLGQRGPVLAIGHEQGDCLLPLLAHIGNPNAGAHVWLASVAPAERSLALVEGLQAAGLRVHSISTCASRGTLRIAYPDPTRLGVDRFLALLAACERDDGPWLIVSAGSALTVDLLDADGRHLGGLIAPMPAAMRAALAQQFSQLDVPEGQSRDFADNTADAIASGAQAALLGLVERASRIAADRLGVVPTLLVCGGAADSLDALDGAHVVKLPWLVLDGMAVFVAGAGH
ncbi:MAG: type III pantothenate kinase [Arenimonas sp.]